MKAYISPMAAKGEHNLPQDIPAKEWKEICHSGEDFLLVDFSSYREVGRWGVAERKRPFIVEHHIRRRGRYPTHIRVGSYGSLSAAAAACRRYSTEREAIAA